METTNMLKLAECPVVRVTVFTDRAEVTRKVVLNDAIISGGGTCCVVLGGLSQHIENDSVRLKGFTSLITIEEVTLERKSAPIESLKHDSQEVQELLQKIEDGLRRVDENEAAKNALLCESTFVDKYVEVMLTGKKAEDDENAEGTKRTSPPIQDFDDVDKLLTHHNRRVCEFRSKLFELKTARQKIEVELTILRERLSKLVPSAVIPQDTDQLLNFVQCANQNATSINKGRGGLLHTADVSMLLTIDPKLQAASAGKEVTLEMSYLVGSARWSPTYDWRIATSETEINLTYFGIVSQSTGEDWKDVELFLSTAKPSVGGHPPPLPTSMVDIKPAIVPVFKESKLHAAKRAPQAMQQQAFLGMPNVVDYDRLEESCDSRSSLFGFGQAAVERTAEVASSADAANATFRIPRSCTVESDNKPHKVTICVVDLKSNFRYYCAPAVSSNVFLQARSINSSDFTFLASSNVSIFLDGTYLAKTSINAVSPGESFSSFLGVDPSVRIRRHREHKVNKEIGLISKARKTEVTCTTVLHNTKNSADVTVIVAQQLPLSKDDKIRVVLINPSHSSLNCVSSSQDDTTIDRMPAGESNPPVLFNKLTNNLLWSRRIPRGTDCEISFVYHIESPVDKEIHYTSRLPNE